MKDKYKIAVVVGSLRQGAFSRMTANALIAVAPPNLEFEFVEIGDLPLYNPDLDEEAPEAWTRFREQVRAVDGVLFVTPEYNRSMPAPLKNAIDVGSRPYGKSAWASKPAGVVSNSPGAMGGFGANHHLRQSLVFLNMPAMPAPEVYLHGVAKLFDEGGNLIADDTRKFLSGFMEAFAAWVVKHA